MRLLITGTAGFIGFHLARKLLESNHEVVGVDNFNDYYCVELKRARDGILRDYARFTSCELDLCDREGLAEAFAHHGPEIVVNLAAQAGVRYSLVNPYAYQKSNLEGFLNIIELSRHHEVQRFVYASSSSVYAGLARMPYSESQRTDTPISLYAATKRANELMAHTYTHLFGLQTIGLRYFTVYGPWGRPDMALWIFTEKILQGEPIPVFNYGDMKRDFTCIDDIMAGTVGAISADTFEACEVLNIGNNRSEHLTDFISVIEKVLGKKAVRRLLPMQPGDVPETYADISRLNRATGYRPTTPITEGIPRFVEWYLDHPEITIKVAEQRQVQPAE